MYRDDEMAARLLEVQAVLGGKSGFSNRRCLDVWTWYCCYLSPRNSSTNNMFARFRKHKDVLAILLGDSLRWQLDCGDEFVNNWENELGPDVSTTVSCTQVC